VIKKFSLFMAVLLVVVIVWVTASVGAQETTPPPVVVNTPVPTALPTSIVTPQDLPSLSGVGGTPLLRNVRIRQQPSLDSRQVGILRFGRFIDIVGTNGFDPERDCSSDFEADLDMWVQVVFREQRGWVARCTLTIYGDLRPLPVEATPPAVG
jgi:hypothetical protein